MTTVIGTRLSGRYRVEDEIGSGGMSTVYRAFDETLEREVAVKMMHSDISSDPRPSSGSAGRRAPSPSSRIRTS